VREWVRRAPEATERRARDGAEVECSRYGTSRAKIAAVKPWEVLGEAATPDGDTMSLTRRGEEYVILAGGRSLMSSRMHGSEEALATFGLARARTRGRPCVLVGGLGMGFTLRATLDLLPPGALVVVAELLPAVVTWNQGPLGPLAGHPLDDPRVHVDVRDVAVVLRSSADRFDAVLLDVDNGPVAFTTAENGSLYGDHGLASARAALRPEGVLAIWSAWEDRRFEQRLRYGGFAVEVHRVRARLKKGGPRHTLFIGQKQDGPFGGAHGARRR
jgi:spermidine synthase